ncbi:ankyrin [Colletotrichum sublineola]|nr:ankyrin [Colletotrichum sublineola]
MYSKDSIGSIEGNKKNATANVGGKLSLKRSPKHRQVQDHKVVIACLPAGTYGITSAATVAKDLLRTFKSIRFGLMVGIGGGAPSQTHDIRLGDIVADHMSEESRIPQVLSELVRKSPKKMKDKFGYQGTLHDHLFQAEYNHANPASTCTSCDPTWAIHRDDRDDKDPVIHYGGIASGNKVIKDGILSEESATMQTPTRINDGKHMQLQQHPRLQRSFFQSYRRPGFCRKNLFHDWFPTHRQDSRYESEEQDKYLQALKTSSYETFKNINPGRVQGTCKWVLDHTRYRAWQQSLHDDLLWISADPGCGKSVLAKSLIDEDFQCTNEHTVCYFFFKDNENQNNLTTALCALLHQLFCFQPILLHYVGAAFALNGKKLRAEVDELWRIFIAAATDGQAPSVTCVLDALDECCVDDRRKIIQFLTNFYNHQTTPPRKSQLKFLVTSRPYQDIELEFRNILEPQTIHLAGEESNTDISEEINHGIKFKVATAGHQLRMNHEVQAAIQEKLLSVPHRTYLWLHLVIDELYQSYKRTKKAFIKKVDTLPITVEDAYEKILGRLNRNQRREAETLLHIVYTGLHIYETHILYKKKYKTKSLICITNVFVAVLNCHDEVLSQLLTWDDSEIDYQGRTGQTPLYWACTKGYDKIVQILLIHGADISTQGGLFGNALQAASSSGHENITQILLSKRADVNAQGGEYGNAIQAALCGGHENIIQMLLIYGADFNPAYKALYNASSRGDDNIVRMLLTKGADVTTQGRFLGNALQAASKAGHESVVRMLLHKGADVNASGGYFDIHAEGGYFGNALQAASKGGYDNICGQFDTALQAASGHGDRNIIQMLLDKGADVNAQGGLFGNALQAASFYGYKNIAQILISKEGEMLISKGADVNAQGGKYGNALQAASKGGYKRIVEMLLSKGADVNASSSKPPQLSFPSDSAPSGIGLSGGAHAAGSVAAGPGR